ncbi:germin-like protein subfamily 2 member 1 [Andrographis paniculata]|uniref:germin-like protein subfamily 2 member 1 n=1 Tax=Andrographis paniculata TaxID=175694 RepID=UPI0021E70020|nr:germin-like protein subfamily 2 member 1 [Andrographis paniculata]
MAAPAASSIKIMMTMTMIAVIIIHVSANDPDPLQDICVADFSSAITVNGYPCKSNVTADDFFFAGISTAGPTNNSVGSLVTGANVQKFPGLNTLGVSLARIDFAPGGVNPPHTHPRATEVIFVLEGALDVGFITTANAAVLRSIKQGEVFVFPKALIHFQINRGDSPAAVISAFNSQLPGTQSIPTALFGAAPPLPDDVLAAAFHISPGQVMDIKSRFAPKN